MAKKTIQLKNLEGNKVIENPRITEKAARISDMNTYTFDVAAKATKVDVAKAIESVYKVKPIKVNVVTVPTKRVFRAKHIGVKGGGRKAYVTLKKGDKIEFI
jgi:large subunit ribosomal protein L23